LLRAIPQILISDVINVSLRIILILRSSANMQIMQKLEESPPEVSITGKSYTSLPQP
jgi:hypothetical protein